MRVGHSVTWLDKLTVFLMEIGKECRSGVRLGEQLDLMLVLMLASRMGNVLANLLVNTSSHNSKLHKVHHKTHYNTGLILKYGGKHSIAQHLQMEECYHM